MSTQLLFADADSFVTPLLTVFAVDIASGTDANPLPTLLTTSDVLSDAASTVLASGEFKAARGETLLLHRPEGLKADRLLIVGLGNVKKLSPDELRIGSGTAVRFAKSKSIRSVAILFPEDRALSDEHLESLDCMPSARSLVEGALLADFDPDTYRSDRKDRSMEGITILAPAQQKVTQDEIREGHTEGMIFAAAQNFTRSLVNEPGNVLTPTELGKRTATMCRAAGLSCEVHSTAKLKELGMGAFLGVAQGSAEPPALIVMRYTPAQPAPGGKIAALVGKGITFDTGGISIKPADGMDKMKYDMAGAGAMIGAMQAIAALKPRIEVISVICSAENMPSGTAYKPGDVLTAMSGKTIEIMNTDAEGRLVLADGLHYAKTLGATHLIDAATLTGAVVVALGKLNSGLFSNDEETCAHFHQAARTAGEHFWRMPCTDDYRELIKSSIADIMNTGRDRWGGSITAAMFLKEFVGETPWVHLDIAGQAWIDEHHTEIAKGPSGVAVRSIVEWVRALAA
ncbi:leucyl aminopeptidase [Terriglobus roseus]|uniref:Probable cytosol aminopeptidase n=1 Tax=Terriglobus roseus TaxID=392734 RepID=A0A1H4T4M9_9BACT|nr:leucyl aminopeptidase [Terriglobus roseus]SEC51386.1 leucyl aminopeptidase [Terriglobus roseus]